MLQESIAGPLSLLRKSACDRRSDKLGGNAGFVRVRQISVFFRSAGIGATRSEGPLSALITRLEK